METLNERIKNLRKKNNLTQLDLAKKVNVTDKAVSKWESGDGNPEIAILIELAKIFDVSLDYLLTGKENKNEIIIMNKLEYCCKKDDPSIFNEIDIEALKNKDENEKTILDYIEEYNSKNIYSALLNRFTLSVLFSKNRNTSLRLLDTDRILSLMFKYDDIHALNQISFFEDCVRNSHGEYAFPYYGFKSIYDEKCLKKMMDTIPNNSLILKKSLSLHENKIKNNSVDWQSVYINILNYALLKDNKTIIEELLNLIIKINVSSIKELEEKELEAKQNRNDTIYSFLTKPRVRDIYYQSYRSVSYSVVATPVNILEQLLNRGYVDEVKVLNECNFKFKEKTISDGLIAAAAMEKEGKSSQDDIFIVSCMEHGIVNIDKLLACKKSRIIKKGLTNYPLFFHDLLYHMFDKKNYRELYKFAIDYEFQNLAKSILYVKSDHYGYGRSAVEKEIKSVIEKVYNNSSYYDNINIETLIVNRSYLQKYSRYNYPRYSIEELKGITQETIEELSRQADLQLDIDDVMSELTDEYLNKLLEDKNFDLLIIKLCVKLEAILRCNYNLEGTLEEIINSFSDMYLRENEDEEEARDICELLKRLRIKRNSIAHPNNNQVELSVKELQKCMKFIELLAKKGV